MTDAEIAALFADLRAKREAIDRLLASLETVYGPQSAASTEYVLPRTEKVRRPRGISVTTRRETFTKPRTAAGTRTLADVVAPRDERRQAILTLLLKEGPLPTRVIATHLKLDRTICKQTLTRMKKVGLLVSTGITNGQRWALATMMATTAPKKPKNERPISWKAPPVDAAAIEARDAAVLGRIAGNNGVASVQELRRWFVASSVAGGGNDVAKYDALQNALLRLKAKGELGRTGDTWSLVGAGVAHA